jgi:hypothetical protein
MELQKPKKNNRTPAGEARRIASITGDLNPAKRPEVRKLISDAKTGVSREEFSQEWLDALSESHMGELNGMYGKTHTDVTKAAQSAKASDKAWVNDGVTSKRINKSDVSDYLAQGWVRGRLVTKSGPRGPYKKKG